MANIHSSSGQAARMMLVARSSRLLAVVLALALGLIACAGGGDAPDVAGEGGQDGGEAAGEPAESPADWPTGPVTVVVPTGVGSSIDLLIRGMQDFLQTELGVPIIIDNRPGGAFAVGIQHVLDAPADGNTILMFTDPAFTFTRLELESGADDWAWLGSPNSERVGVIARTEAFGSFDDFAGALRDNEAGPVAVIAREPASVGLASLVESIGLPHPDYLFYEGGGELRVDLLGGHVDVSIGTEHALGRDLVDEGAHHYLMFFSDERPEDFPDTPTAYEIAEEHGVSADAVPRVSNTRFLVVRSEVAEEFPERYERLLEAVHTASHSEGYQTWAERAGVPMVWTDPDALRQSTVDYEGLIEQIPEEFTQ